MLVTIVTLDASNKKATEMDQGQDFLECSSGDRQNINIRKPKKPQGEIQESLAERGLLLYFVIYYKKSCI